MGDAVPEPQRLQTRATMLLVSEPSAVLSAVVAVTAPAATAASTGSPACRSTDLAVGFCPVIWGPWPRPGIIEAHTHIPPPCSAPGQAATPTPGLRHGSVAQHGPRAATRAPSPAPTASTGEDSYGRAASPSREAHGSAVREMGRAKRMELDAREGQLRRRRLDEEATRLKAETESLTRRQMANAAASAARPDPATAQVLQAELALLESDRRSLMHVRHTHESAKRAHKVALDQIARERGPGPGRAGAQRRAPQVPVVALQALVARSRPREQDPHRGRPGEVEMRRPASHLNSIEELTRESLASRPRSQIPDFEDDGAPTFSLPTS
ncbi:hypothetical protein PAPYR_11759 [Paratrimastix pyriformis]|uniref:Uncharacterized protein n=1 Tax=Paratrimastix pyriformis TaxID=342808 RepID=A0ABQ8U5J3_9EUKA|nr:hypothetical protein PAPYR_11759 [Paratrimastix pyriformis]